MNDFFSANKKKDKKKGRKATAADDKPAAPEEAKAVAAATDDASKAAAADGFDVAGKAKAKPVSRFDDVSDDEEEANIVLRDDLKNKLKDKKQVDAARRAKEEKKHEQDGLGWAFGEKMEKETKSEPSQADQPSQPKKAGGFGEINFSGSRPTFTKANNSKVIHKQEFPELGDFAGKKPDVLKKDGMYGASGSAAVASEPEPREQRRQPDFKKPMFFGTGKLNFGTGEEDTSAKKYSYDMDALKGKSTASSKPSAPKGTVPAGGAAGQPRPRMAAGFGGEDDFETVTEKKKVIKRPPFERENRDRGDRRGGDREDDGAGFQRRTD